MDPWREGEERIFRDDGSLEGDSDGKIVKGI